MFNIIISIFLWVVLPFGLLWLVKELMDLEMYMRRGRLINYKWRWRWWFMELWQGGVVVVGFLVRPSRSTVAGCNFRRSPAPFMPVELIWRFQAAACALLRSKLEQGSEVACPARLFLAGIDPAKNKRRFHVSRIAHNRHFLSVFSATETCSLYAQQYTRERTYTNRHYIEDSRKFFFSIDICSVVAYIVLGITGFEPHWMDSFQPLRLFF